MKMSLPSFSRLAARWAQRTPRRPNRSAYPADASRLFEPLESRVLMSAAITHYDGSVIPSDFITSVVAEGRIGRVGTSTFEADIGSNTASPAQTIEFGTAPNHWQNGVVKSFSLQVDASGNATYTINGHSVAYTGQFSGTDLLLRVRANNATNTVVLSNLQLDGVAINDTATTSGMTGNQETMRISDADLADGFTLTGDATMTWTGNMPTNSNLAFQVSWATQLALNTASVQDTGLVATEIGSEPVVASTQSPASGQVVITPDGAGVLTLNAFVTGNTLAAAQITKFRVTNVTTNSTIIMANTFLPGTPANVALAGVNQDDVIKTEFWLDYNGNNQIDANEVGNSRTIAMTAEKRDGYLQSDGNISAISVTRPTGSGSVNSAIVVVTGFNNDRVNDNRLLQFVMTDMSGTTITLPAGIGWNAGVGGGQASVGISVTAAAVAGHYKIKVTSTTGNFGEFIIDLIVK